MYFIRYKFNIKQEVLETTHNIFHSFTEIPRIFCKFSSIWQNNKVADSRRLKIILRRHKYFWLSTQHKNLVKSPMVKNHHTIRQQPEIFSFSEFVIQCSLWFPNYRSNIQKQSDTWLIRNVCSKLNTIINGISCRTWRFGCGSPRLDTYLIIIIWCCGVM